MPRSDRSDSIFRLISVIMILLGLCTAGLRLTLAIASPSGANTVLTSLAGPLLGLWLLTVLTWAWLSVLRWRQNRARRYTTKTKSIQTARRVRPSTMQTQWKQPDPGTAWANTHHDTRTRTTSTERNSNLNWMAENSAQSIVPQHNSLQPDTLLSHTIAPNSTLRHPAVPICWTLELLQELEWRRFETIAAGFFRSIGLDARPLAKGPDAEVSLQIWQPGVIRQHALARTRAGAPVIDLDQVRLLYGVMTREQVKQAFYVTGGRFTAEAMAAARGIGMFLIDGPALYKRIVSLPPEQQETLLHVATEGDYRTPSCPDCGRKMALRSGDFKSFWRCTGYPECRCRMVLSGDTPAPPH